MSLTIFGLIMTFVTSCFKDLLTVGSWGLAGFLGSVVFWGLGSRLSRLLGFCRPSGLNRFLVRMLGFWGYVFLGFRGFCTFWGRGCKLFSTALDSGSRVSGLRMRV